MRLPRHDTRLSLSADAPRDVLARDEALLDEVRPGGPTLVRWSVASRPALVVGLAGRHRAPQVIDLERCAARGIEVLERRSGGGAVLIDQHVLCAAICVPQPDPRIGADLTESYRWVGQAFAEALRREGLVDACRVNVAEARQDVARLKERTDPVARALLAACYGTLSPHEVVCGTPPAKVVGLAQVRRRHATLFQVGVLTSDQSALADLLRMPDNGTREALRNALRQRTAGVGTLEPHRLISALQL